MNPMKSGLGPRLFCNTGDPPSCRVCTIVIGAVSSRLSYLFRPQRQTAYACTVNRSSEGEYLPLCGPER
jgi:hypothetical protein